LQFDIIRRAVNRLNTLKAGGRKIGYLIVTNGTIITDEIVRFCKSNNVVLQITLDGKNDVHDKNRVFRNGKGSFDKIVRNIRKVKASGLDYYLRTNISQDSKYPKELLDYYRSIDIAPQPGKPNNGIMYAIVTGLPVEKRSAFLRDFDFAQLAHSMFESFLEDESEYKLTYHVNILKIFNSFIYTNHIKRSCGVFNNRLAVKYDGSIFPCHKWVNDPEFSIGTVEDGLNRLSDESITIPVIEKDPICRMCEYKYFCGGFCHFNSLFNKDAADGPYCRFTRSLTPLVLRYIVDSYENDRGFFRRITKGLTNINESDGNDGHKVAFGDWKQHRGNGVVTVPTSPQPGNRHFRNDLFVSKSANAHCIDLGEKGILVSTSDLGITTNFIANTTTMAVWDLADGSKTARQVASEIASICGKHCSEVENDIIEQIAVFEQLGLLELKDETASLSGSKIEHKQPVQR
jgi:radical SAM protein with 4Fe4S-binding SPASM domain